MKDEDIIIIYSSRIYLNTFSLLFVFAVDIQHLYSVNSVCKQNFFSCLVISYRCKQIICSPPLFKIISLSPNSFLIPLLMGFKGETYGFGSL